VADEGDLQIAGRRLYEILLKTRLAEHWECQQ